MQGRLRTGSKGIARKRSDADFELVDIGAFALPLLNEPLSARAAAAMQRNYVQQHTIRWSMKIASFDGFVIVTPEYNFGLPAALKNALDYLYTEWNNKAAGFVSYGSAGGVRATAQLRLTLAELQVATVGGEANLSLNDDFENFTQFKPRSVHQPRVEAMLDQLVAWSGALKPLRQDDGGDA